MEPRFFNIPVIRGDVPLSVAKGHFATRNSHTNYFIDVTRQRSSIRDAESVAKQLIQRMTQQMMVDTILCMDGTRVIGTCLAQRMTQGGFRSLNAGKDIYVLRENIGANGQLLFRDNARFMLEGKNILLLMASVTTGATVRRGIHCAEYYQGKVAGITALYSDLKEVDGIPVVALFDTSDIPDYASYHPDECPMCKAKQELDAVIDKFGYSAL